MTANRKKILTGILTKNRIYTYDFGYIHTVKPYVYTSYKQSIHTQSQYSQTIFKISPCFF